MTLTCVCRDPREAEVDVVQIDEVFHFPLELATETPRLRGQLEGGGVEAFTLDDITPASWGS